MPSNALILFGAHWCAPCTGELHDLAEISAAVAALRPAGHPPQIVLAWIDRPLHIAAAEPRAIVVLAPTVAQTLAESPLATARGLPFTVATDARGKICALHRGPLRADMIAGLWARCTAEL
jgi:hypothetical protein